MGRTILAGLVATAALALAWPASAHLKPGAAAPDFKTVASLGGKEFPFVLSEALKQGPVVLYFYPAAFTKGCTVEAHDFADAIEDYKKLGATVIGVSHDKIETLDKFSVSECRSKFAVAADPDQTITKAYDSVLKIKPEYADRVSYVITPDGKVNYVFSSLSPDQHVANTLAALKAWRASH